MMVGDSAWGLANDISLSDMATYFATRRSQGFNTALVELVADSFGGVGAVAAGNAVTFDGVNAFTGTVTGGFPDVTTPNRPFWSRMDSMVSLAATAGSL